MMLYISMKFHENIWNSFQVKEQTQFCDRQKDGQTINSKTMTPPLSVGVGGDIILLLNKSSDFDITHAKYGLLIYSILYGYPHFTYTTY